MGKGAATREAIVDQALRQATLQGFRGTSLGPLATELGLSKSGLFAHFHSKEALQLAVIEEALQRFRDGVVVPAGRQSSPRARLIELMNRYLDWIDGEPDGGGCLFMTLAQEFDDEPGAVRDRLVEGQLQWRKHLIETIEEAVARGELRSDTDSSQLVFELLGTAMAYQHARRLLRRKDARANAAAAIARILEKKPSAPK